MYKKQTLELMTKVQKFMSHFLFNIQSQILGNVDVEFNKWQSMREEITELHKRTNYVEIFLKRNEYQVEIDDMKRYLNKHVYFFEEDCFFSQIKSQVYERVRDEMMKVLSVFDFVQNESVIQQFDELLETERVEELQRLMQE